MKTQAADLKRAAGKDDENQGSKDLSKSDVLGARVFGVFPRGRNPTGAVNVR